MIDPEIWRNEKVGSLPDAARLLFIGIFSQADDDGRLKASPPYLMATIFPYDKGKAEGNVKSLRDQCAELGLIRLYTNSKEEYLDIPGWHEHQQIRKDRYTPSKLPSYEESNGMATKEQPSGNHLAPIDQPSIVKSSLVKSNTPKGARKKRADPTISEVFSEMRSFLGYLDVEVCGGEAVPAIEENSAMTADRRVDPIPNYGKEGKAISRMLTRGFSREEIVACWKDKVSQRGGEFVSMTWVNNDISSKGDGHGEPRARARPTKGPSDTPRRTDGGFTSEQYAASEAAYKARHNL